MSLNGGRAGGRNKGSDLLKLRKREDSLPTEGFDSRITPQSDLVEVQEV